MIRKVAIGVGALLLLVYALLLVVPIDPVERRPGTRLGGEMAADQAPDWGDYGRKQIAVQTRTWYLVPHGGHHDVLGRRRPLLRALRPVARGNAGRGTWRATTACG